MSPPLFDVHCLPVQSERRDGFKKSLSHHKPTQNNHAQFNDLPGRNRVQALGITSTQQKQTEK
jgi:hypothetical protein